MATTFEVVLACDDGRYAEQAADAAFDELERLERELSRFVPSSDVSRVNALGAREPVRIGADARDCLVLAAFAHAETCGAFDPTVGALSECWRAALAAGREPAADELARARGLTGLGLVRLDEEAISISLAAEGVRLDLGGIGKGYALDRMAELLADWGIRSALLHAGRSSALALGEPPHGAAAEDADGWRVGLRDPRGGPDPMGAVVLRGGRALSGSGVALHGPHILDPRTGRPVSGRLGAWAFAPSAGLSDALSTAFMVMSESEARACCDRNPGVGGMILSEEAGRLVERRFGCWG